MKKNFVCICCPRGCNLTYDSETQLIKGNFCIKGKEYGIQEMNMPSRMFTSLIRVSNRKDTMLSVKSNKPVPKEKIFDIVNEISAIKVAAPIEIGQIIVKNILNLDIDIIATKRIR